MSADQVILEKIRKMAKLINLSEDKGAGEAESARRAAAKLAGLSDHQAASEADVEKYIAMAKKLIQEHNHVKHQGLINDKNAQQTAYDSVVKEWTGFERKGDLDPFDRLLINVVCDICEVRAFINSTATSKRDPEAPMGKAKFDKKKKTWLPCLGTYYHSVWFYGLPTDVAVAHEFFKELRVAVRTLARVRLGQKWTRSHTDYAFGFANTLCIRSAKFKRETSPGANCTAIVLAKDNILDRWQRDKLNLGEGKACNFQMKDLDAYYKGAEDGRNYDLGTENRLTPGK